MGERLGRIDRFVVGACRLCGRELEWRKVCCCMASTRERNQARRAGKRGVVDFRILCSGDRYWRDARAVRNALEGWDVGLGLRPDQIVIIEGEADGADTYCRRVGEMLGYAVEPYPAEWDKYHRAAGPIRNQQMIEEGEPDICIAFHDDLVNSKGTKDMVTQFFKQVSDEIYLVESRFKSD